MKNLLLFSLLLIILLYQGVSFAGDKPKSQPNIPDGSKQLILVISPDWSSPLAKLYLYERKDKTWVLVKACMSAVVGKKGMAWGIGLHLMEGFGGAAPLKQEGDLKAPAGIFTIGNSMGYADSLPFLSLIPYREATENTIGVDDSASKYYNQIIDSTAVPDSLKHWKSFERMRRKDDLYKWLAVIEHNIGNIKGKGSLIFLHIWKRSDSGTAGCTATSEDNVLQILQWLDEAKKPIIVQLPANEYKYLRKDWHLPDVKLAKEIKHK